MYNKMDGEMKKDFILNLDYYGVLNLHKALLEAKFHINPDNGKNGFNLRTGLITKSVP